MSANYQLIERVAAALCRNDLTLITAESCTGGLLASDLTAIPGSSTWFEGAFVTYRLSAKERMLHVPAHLLARHGAVSEPTARAMAEGALEASAADVSVAITGVAGPEGGDVVTPVGTVWFAWAIRNAHGKPRCVQTAEHRFQGSRNEVRERAVMVALEGIAATLG